MKYIILLFTTFIYFQVKAQVTGKMFPDLSGEKVSDEKVNIPQDCIGKYTLLGLAYSKKSEEDLNTWFKPVHSTFIRKPTGMFAQFAHDVNVYFIPMFTGIKAAASGSAKRKASRKMDPQLLPYVVFYKGSLKDYKKTLEFDQKDLPYFFVLDPGGKIIYATTGRFSQAKLDEIEQLVSQ
ncbi:MAG: hypothetical protein ACNS62_10485 [Candidatus Cyclobacteriaceae bacterium M3_2C_046]